MSLSLPRGFNEGKEKLTYRLGKLKHRSRKARSGLYTYCIHQYTLVIQRYTGQKRRNIGLRRNTCVWKQEIHENG
uniref:Uncharacterized protein n=1 Tax=Solanum tuberosum TaxID=4113 RepID=M0ZYY9_SOLTU